jgi:hypothetical protein
VSLETSLDADGWLSEIKQTVDDIGFTINKASDYQNLCNYYRDLINDHIAFAVPFVKTLHFYVRGYLMQDIDQRVILKDRPSAEIIKSHLSMF